MAYANIQDRRLPFVIRYIVDLFSFRHLCWNLVGSDLRSRFRRSRLGILWAILQPLGFSLIIAYVWGGVFKVQDYWTFAIYVFSGVIVWEYFSVNIIVAQDALVGAEGYLKQTRVPFFIFQLRTPLTAMVILFCGILGLFIMQAALQKLPPFGMHLLLIPAFLGLILAFCIPLATIMSVVGAQFRDVKHISQLAIQAMFFLTPVMLDRGIIERPDLAWMKFANPMVPMLDLFRQPTLHGQMWPQTELITVGIWIAALWVVAFIVQMRAGRRLIFAI